VEADHKDAASLPIAFWFNGGPGCSSIGDGLLSELGPFRVNASEDLILNEQSWNKGTIDQQLILLAGRSRRMKVVFF
jgi:serine carboxypeptidase-like clade 2